MNKTRKTKDESVRLAGVVSSKLLEWLPENLKENEDLARKVACVVWYDKISNHISADPYILDIVRSTEANLNIDITEVVDVLVNDFDYPRDFAIWRMGGRALR